MIHDYNVWNEQGFDFWSEEPSEALCAFIECLIRFPGTVPVISQYDVGLDADGYRTTITDHWTRLTWQELFDRTIPITSPS
jgi:hypothetical protein